MVAERKKREKRREKRRDSRRGAEIQEKARGIHFSFRHYWH
jgi:hypothetical protein